MNERLRDGLRIAPKIGIGGVLFAGALMFPMDSDAKSFSVSKTHELQTGVTLTPQVEAPPINSPEILRSNCTILFADGLGGKGHKSRDFFAPIARVADQYGVTYDSVLPKNPDDPEKDEWTKTFIKQIENEANNNKDVILLGYSMGAREVLELEDALLDLSKPTYNLELLSHIKGIALAGSRDNEMKNATNHPELKNYAPHYETKSNGKSQVSISPENMDKIKARFGDKTVIFGEPGDTTTPESQGMHLSQQIGARYVSVNVTNSNGQPDNHFSTVKPWEIISQTVETMIKSSCQSEK